MNKNNLNPENVKNILVVRKHNQIGDMLCSLGLYAALKKKYPNAKITLVVSPTNYQIDFNEINPYADEVIVYRKGSIGNILKFYRELRQKKYQIGIVPSTIKISDTSHIINFLSGAKVRIGVKGTNGKRNKMAFLLNVKCDFNWEKTHQTQRNVDIARQIGCELTEEEKNSIKINLSKEDSSFADEYFSLYFPDKNTPVIGYHPGAGENYRMWKTENFIELIKRIYDKYKCYLLITSGEIDNNIIDEIKTSPILAGIKIVYAEGLPLKKLAAVLQRLTLYITNNTGTLHIAHFCGARTLALFTKEQDFDWAYKSENESYISADNVNDVKIDEVFGEVCRLIERSSTGTI